MNNWLLVLLLCQTVTWSVKARCLTNGIDIHRKNFFYSGNSSKIITIESSNRITHNISSNIFLIFLQEILGYSEVEIVIANDGYNASSALDRVSLVDDDQPIDPSVMINLEVLADFGFTVNAAGRQNAYEAGLVAPFGRFGWYVSRGDNLRWLVFKDFQQAYQLSKDEIEMAKKYSREYCRHKLCSEGHYIPPKCKNTSCATLLADDFNSTKVVMDHIVQMNFSVEVLWLGPHLASFISNNLKNRDVLVMTWSPGPVTISGKWIPVVICPCWNNAPECFYEPRRLVKLVSTEIISGASSAFHSLKLIEFTRHEYEDLVLLSLESPHKSHYDIACDWMRENRTIYKNWDWEGSNKPELIICGIFPLSGPLLWKTLPVAANMAIKAVNNNTNVLNQFNLKLVKHDGQCDSDTVTNIFINYAIAYDVKQMVGILGPACSDTVEPLVGITKYFRTVVISYGAEGALFSNKEKQPYFFRTIGENQQFKQVYLKILKRMGWKRMAALTEDGQKYTEYLSYLQDLLQSNNLTFITHRKFPRHRANATMRTYLEDLQARRARIIVADVHDVAARSVMCEAYHLKMTAVEGYVWFLPQWLSRDWYDTSIHREDTVSCSTEQMRKAIWGHFSLSHEYFAPDDQMTHENITVGQWKKTYKAFSKNKTLSNYAAYAYDAIWMYAYALDKLHRHDKGSLSNVHTPNASGKFMEYLQATDFMGVSGQIKFRSGSSRVTNVNILQWIDGTFNLIGVALYNLSDPSDKIDYRLELDVSKIWWYKDQPSDGEELPPTCMLQRLAEFLGVSCNSAIVIANVIGFACFTVVLIGAVAITKRKYDQKVEALEKADRFIKSMGIDLLPSLSDLDKWEIPRDRVVINRRLGEGAFGTVYGGEAFFEEDGWVAAAVKTLKVNSTTEVKLDFLSEAEVMKRFDHKNIVKLLGVCTRDEPVYTVMEFMLYGDLKTFLLNRRHMVATGRRLPDESNEVSNKKLTGMALDIARGLSYLASLKYVHRDVACRNCLLNGARVAKIGDFGLTRRMYESDYYKFTRKGMMPVRWMAPECLADGIFTTKSDVWSFGIVLYEIVTFGSYPYQGLGNNQVMDYVKAGNTIEIPKSVKPMLETLMKSCWTLDYTKRPDITEIVVFLGNNPRMLSPCLEGPTSSVAVEDTELFQGRPSVPASPFEPANNFILGDSEFNLGDRETTPPASPTELDPSGGFFSDNAREQLLPANESVHIAMQRLAPLASRTPSDIDLQSGIL